MLAFLSALLLLPTTPLTLPPKPHTVDKAHSEINFVAEARFLSAHGFFGTWDADVQVDRENMANSTVKITIDSKSINTRNDRRDGHLKSNDFFATDSFPTITFVSKKIVASGDKQYQMTGDLTIRGRTREVTIPIKEQFYEPGANGGRGRWKGAFSVKRMEYGIAFQSRLNPIEDEIQIQWDFSLVESPAAGK
jgi:polyisoprenoid-binding protein YceI